MFILFQKIHFCLYELTLHSSSYVAFVLLESNRVTRFGYLVYIPTDVSPIESPFGLEMIRLNN